MGSCRSESQHSAWFVVSAQYMAATAIGMAFLRVPQNRGFEQHLEVGKELGCLAFPVFSILPIVAPTQACHLSCGIVPQPPNSLLTSGLFPSVMG